MTPLRIPKLLAFTIVGSFGAAGTIGAIATTTTGCDQAPPVGDAACVYCIYETVDNGNCPPPTCATGDHQDVCPEGCVPAPIA